MQKKILTISLLVSGRKDTTEKCLDSLKRLLDELDSELILVDTGCDDELRQVLKRYTEQIIPFTWCNDFAKARNAGLEAAGGEWFLFLDDDEWFEDVTPILDFFQSGEYKGYHQAVYKVRSYTNMQGTAYNDAWVSRMIHIDPDTRFVGKVHEYLAPVRGKCKELDAFAHHYGYAFADSAEEQEHLKRNVSLLLDMIEEEPMNIKWRIQLVQEYASVGHPQELRKAAEEALEIMKNSNTAFLNQCRGVFYSAAVLSYREEKAQKETEEACLTYLQDSRNTLMCQCNLYRYAAEAAQMQGNYETAEAYCRNYFKTYDANLELDLDEQERIIADTIIFVRDAGGQEVYDKMLLLWAECIARLPEQGKVLPAEKWKQLKSHIAKMFQDNGDFLRLSDKVWTIGRAGIVDVEEIVLKLEFSQWMASVTLLQSGATIADWNRVEQNLDGIQTVDDIRYDYVKMNYAKNLILQKAVEESYEAMCSRLQIFSESCLRFYQQIFQPSAFEGEMEMLPDSCQAAVWAKAFLECGEDAWEEKIACLGKCAKAYLPLGENIKLFAKMTGEEQKKRQQAADEAFVQLRQMAEQMKPKLRLMIDAGMTAEALPVVRQLRGMLPDDNELAELEKVLGGS